MKILLLALTLFVIPAHAGPYLQLGIGWIDEVPVEASAESGNVEGFSVNIKQKAIVDLDEPFAEFAFGYRFESTNIHIEYHRFGVLDDSTQSISTYRLYKRWEWD